MDNISTVAPLPSKATLYLREGSGFRKARPHEVIIQAEALILQKAQTRVPILNLPRRTAAFLRVHFASQTRPTFGILHLGTRARLIEAEDLISGAPDAISVEPREVLKSVLAHQSASVVLYQNYPSTGQVWQPDLLRAYRLRSLLGLIDVELRDFVVIGANTTYSMAQSRLL